MKEKSATAMRDTLADMLGILEYKVRNDAISSEDVRAILTTLEAGGGVRATVSDIAGYYHKSEADVRNVIHRNLQPSRGSSQISAGNSSSLSECSLRKAEHLKRSKTWDLYT